jgi:hypothetical protein
LTSNRAGHVFISYSQSDSAFVRRLAADLQARGIRIWYDTQNIQPGTNWRTAIESALHNSFAIISVISRSSLASAWVRLELQSSLTSNKRVYPILIESVASEQVGFLSELQWIDFRDDYDRALERLLFALPVEAKTEPTHRPDPHPAQASRGYAFISFSEDDADFVDLVARFLASKGYGYWDFRTADRNYQAQFFLELEEVIRNAAATISVLSPSWKRSDWALKEYIYSLEVGVPVYLLRWKDMGPTLVIAGVPYIDFSEDTTLGFERLARALERSGLA